MIFIPKKVLTSSEYSILHYIQLLHSMTSSHEKKSWNIVGAPSNLDFKVGKYQN